MLRIAIVEDEDKVRQEIKEYIAMFERESGQQILVEEYADGLDLTENYKAQYDAIFCDIQMKHMDGMRASEAIRNVDRDVCIIFVTNLAEYAIQGYEVAASGFLIKPINYTMLKRYLVRLVETVGEKEKKYLVVEEKSGIRRFLLKDIYYITHENHYLCIHTVHGEESVRLSVHEVEEELEYLHFVKCNSGTIVNLEHVLTIRGNEIVVGDTTLLISRSRKKAVSEAMNCYLGRNVI